MSLKWDRYNIIFEYLKDNIQIDENIIFTYLRKSKIEDNDKEIYLLLDLSITKILNNKYKMGKLLDNEKITPKIYQSCEDLLKENYNKDKIWFIKYINGSCGQHILCKTTEQLKSIEISNKFIIQEGITNLDLYKGYKYTLRVFTLIYDNKFYLYTGIKKRVHNEKYIKDSTNYSAQVCGSNYLERIPIYLDIDNDLCKKFINHSLLVKEKLKEIINQSNKYKYLLIGNDYLVKSDKDVILIEMNPHPDLVNNDYINHKINIPLMKDTINLIVHKKISNYILI